MLSRNEPKLVAKIRKKLRDAAKSRTAVCLGKDERLSPPPRPSVRVIRVYASNAAEGRTL